MSATSLPQLQTALITRLKATSAFLSLVVGVYDDVPERPGYPHVVYDDPFESPDRFFGQNGHDVIWIFDVFTQDGSRDKATPGHAGFSQGLTIAEALLEALAIEDPANWVTVAGHDVVDMDVISVHAVRETDGVTRRVEITMTATLEDTP
jgi:hypothetical protein